MILINLPYKEIVLHKRNHDDAEESLIRLLYNTNSRKIMKQMTPYGIMCPECETIFDHKWVYQSIDVIVPQLLSVGWRHYGD
jgi:hypothetical protein